MSEQEQGNQQTGRIKFWLGQAFISLAAAYIAAQGFRHGTLAKTPTAGDVIPTLIVFAIIFAVVAGINRLSARLNEESEHGGASGESGEAGE